MIEMMHSGVEEVPVQVLHDQRKPGLAGVARMRFGHSASRRGLPHRAVVGLAVVVAGEPEGQQERQRQRGVRQPPHVGQELAEVAGSRLASGAHARRVERRQVVVVLNPVGAAPECPDGRVDDERGETEIGQYRWHPPPVGAQGALRYLGAARRKDAGRWAVGGGCAHGSLSWLRFPIRLTSSASAPASALRASAHL